MLLIFLEVVKFEAPNLGHLFTSQCLTSDSGPLTLETLKESELREIRSSCGPVVINGNGKKEEDLVSFPHGGISRREGCRGQSWPFSTVTTLHHKP